MKKVMQMGCLALSLISIGFWSYFGCKIYDYSQFDRLSEKEKWRKLKEIIPLKQLAGLKVKFIGDLPSRTIIDMESPKGFPFKIILRKIKTPEKNWLELFPEKTGKRSSQEILDLAVNWAPEKPFPAELISLLQEFEKYSYEVDHSIGRKKKMRFSLLKNEKLSKQDKIFLIAIFAEKKEKQATIFGLVEKDFLIKELLF